MAKVKVKVLDAVVDGYTKDSEITVDEKSAEHLESIGYVERVGKKSSTNNDGDGKDN